MVFSPQVHREQRHPGAVQVHLQRTEIADSPVSVPTVFASSSLPPPLNPALPSPPGCSLLSQVPVQQQPAAAAQRPLPTAGHPHRPVSVKWLMVPQAAEPRFCRFQHVHLLFAFLAGTCGGTPSAATVRSSGWWTGWRSPTPRSRPSTALAPSSSKDAGSTTWRRGTLTASPQVTACPGPGLGSGPGCGPNMS